jgi:uncharacterized membrane protein
MSNQTIEAEASDDRLWALIAYILAPWISIFMLVFMRDQKTSSFLNYHVIQALAWGISWIVLTALGVGICLFPLIIIYTVYLGIKAYRGEVFEIPLLTRFLLNMGWI